MERSYQVCWTQAFDHLFGNESNGFDRCDHREQNVSKSNSLHCSISPLLALFYVITLIENLSSPFFHDPIRHATKQTVFYSFVFLVLFFVRNDKNPYQKPQTMKPHIGINVRFNFQLPPMANLSSNHGDDSFYPLTPLCCAWSFRAMNHFLVSHVVFGHHVDRDNSSPTLVYWC